MILKLAVFVIVLNTEWARGMNQAVWLEDITHNARARNLDRGLPETLQFKLKRSGKEDLTLNLVENKRLNQNAPVYEVHTGNGQQKLVKKETRPITDVKFYHDKKNGGSFMVECSKRKQGACRRTLTGSLEISNEAYEINPTTERFVSRSLALNKLNPHMLTRVVVRSGQGIASAVDSKRYVDKEEDALLPPGGPARGTSAGSHTPPKPGKSDDDDGKRNFGNNMRAVPSKPEPVRDFDSGEKRHIKEHDLKDKLTNELRRLLLKSEIDAFTEKLHLNRQKRQSTNPYAVEILVGVDSSVWNRYYASAVATDTMTKEEANELFIRKRFSHIINGISLRYESIDDAALNIYVTMTGIIIYKTVDVNNPLPNAQSVETVDGRQVADGGFYLNKLVDWLAGLSGAPDNDHAMVFTQYDIYTTSGSVRSYDTSGISWLDNVCKEYRVSIQENNDYYVTTSVASHELGHNLGSHHDGYQNDADAAPCSASDKFIMAPSVTIFHSSVAYTVNAWRFSTCSVAQFKNYIQSLDAENPSQNCLLDAGNSTDEYNEHKSKQPGELHSPDEQCQLEYGEENGLGCGMSATNPVICQYMYCGPTTGSCWVMTAARGTPCDDPALNKWCKEGQCVAKETTGTASAPDTSAAPQNTTAPDTTAAPETTSTPQTTTTSTSTTTSAEDCYDYGYYRWTCPALDNFFRANYNMLPHSWCQNSNWGYRCCQYCRANQHITTTLPPMPEDCINTGWYNWSCEKVSNYFKDTYDDDPKDWCTDPYWRDKCCVTCYENGIYVEK